LAIGEVTYGNGFTVAELGEIFNSQAWDASRNMNVPSKNAQLPRASLPGSLQNAQTEP